MYFYFKSYVVNFDSRKYNLLKLTNFELDFYIESNEWLWQVIYLLYIFYSLNLNLWKFDWIKISNNSSSYIR